MHPASGPDRRPARLRAAAWLTGAGLRPTRQRLALAELLVGDGRNRHVTAESLHEAARQPRRPGLARHRLQHAARLLRGRA